MKVFVTGVGGQLGYDVIRELKKRNIECVASDIHEEYPILKDDIDYISLDIANEIKVKEIINEIKPDVVIHCAAYTAVDLAEEEANYDKVYAINTLGTKYITEAIKDTNTKMVYISTDYIFNDESKKAIKPDSKVFKPINVYGQTKLDGELFISSLIDKFFIVRISWVFGINGNNFVKTMLKLSDKYDEIRVVNDQIGTPTYTYDLARLLVDMIKTDKYGYYHVTNEDNGNYISWYDFAKEIFKQAHKSTKVIPVSTKEYGLSKAKRPYNSRLDKTKLTINGFKTLPMWDDALSRYLKELENNDI